MLSDRGLAHALSSLANRATVPVELHAALPAERLPIAVEAAAYFTVCEALTNVAKYAQRDAAPGSTSSCAATSSTSRSATTASAAPTSTPAQASKGCATGSPRSTERSHIDSRPGAGTVLRARLPV